MTGLAAGAAVEAVEDDDEEDEEDDDDEAVVLAVEGCGKVGVAGVGTGLGAVGAGEAAGTTEGGGLFAF